MYKEETMTNEYEIEDDFESQDETKEYFEKIDESSTPDITKPFDPTKINITITPLIIDSLVKRMKSNPPRIDLNTDFQRRGGLWGEIAQSRFIESLLVRIPIPAFYFDGSEDTWKVVDGLQRLFTLKRFIIDKELKLENLEFLNKYNGKKFDDLPAYLQGRIEETHITAFVINPGTPDDVKYNIFKRINTGGIFLNPQEIRHALNQGFPANFVAELAASSEFNKATQNLFLNHKRMEDRDLVTRFIAFYNGYEHYSTELDEYLHNAMKNLSQLSDTKREQIKCDFKKAMNAAFDIFGEYAFRKRYKIMERKHPINKALFDTWSVNLAHLSDENIKVLISKKEMINNRFIELIKSDVDFNTAITISTGNIRAVKKRFLEIKQLLYECLNDNKYQA